MKNHNLDDERVLAEKRQVESVALKILIAILLISMVIQQFILHEPFSVFAAEFFCVTAIGAYLKIKYLLMGINIWDASLSKRKIIANGVVYGMLVSVTFPILTGDYNTNTIMILFIIMTVGYIASYFSMQWLNAKRQKQIDQALDKQE